MHEPLSGDMVTFTAIANKNGQPQLVKKKALVENHGKLSKACDVQAYVNSSSEINWNQDEPSTGHAGYPEVSCRRWCCC